jgi:manganese/zinc/iron transport system substrate-binding protein
MVDVFERLAERRPTVRVTGSIPEAQLRKPDGYAGGHDPHVWFDASLWMRVVARIRDAYIEVDPAHADAYRQRADAYLAQVRRLHEEAQTRIAQIPRERRVLITAHDAFGYFGRAYDVEVRGLQGISTDSEASLKDVNDLVEQLVARKIRAVFVESSVPRKNIEALVEGCRARGHRVRVGGELFSDALGPAGKPEGTYLGMFRHNVETIVEALQ